MRISPRSQQGLAKPLAGRRQPRDDRPVSIFRAEPDPRLDPTRQALRRTADAWEHGFTAAIGHDVQAARRVMRGAPARRSMLHTAQQHLQWGDATPASVPHRSSPTDVVADLMRLNRLLAQLSQSIIAAPDVDTLDDRQRADLDVARRVGAERLAYFADSMPRPHIDHDYVTAGHAHLDALADLADSMPRRGSTADICLCLMIVLVETSRHATRIA